MMGKNVLRNEVLADGYCDELSCECDEAFERREKIPVHQTVQLGLEVVLHNAAERVFCVNCGYETLSIPNMDGLVAATAMVRLLEPTKLDGKDIKFLRKAAEMPATALAKELEVTPETVSRWENEKAPIGASVEKLFRLSMAERFAHLAPCVPYTAAAILNMNVRACTPADRSRILHLTLVPYLETSNQPVKDVYSRTTREAA